MAATGAAPIDVRATFAQARKHVLDSGLMLLFRLSSALVGIVIYAVCMRKYGPDALGKYAYVVALCQFFAPLLVSGIEPILVRELVRRRDEKLELLGSAVMLLLMTTCIAAGAPMLYVLATDSADRDIVYMAAGLTISMLPNCLLVLMAFLRAESKITLATTCGIVGVLGSAVVRVAIVLWGKPLYFVTAAAILEPLISAVMLLVIYRRYYGPVSNWQFSWPSMRSLFRLGWSAVLAGLVVTLFFRITHVMLKSLSSFDQVGYYAVAFQMFTFLNFLPNSVLAVLYPRLLQLYQASKARYLDAIRTVYVLVTLAGAILCVLVWLLIHPSIVLVFGAASAPAAPVAIAMAVANLFSFSGAVRGQVIYIEHHPVYHVYNSLLGLAVLVPLNLVLIPMAGALGAAISVAIACFVSAVASSWVFPALRSTGADQALAFIGMRRRMPAGTS